MKLHTYLLEEKVLPEFIEFKDKKWELYFGQSTQDEMLISYKPVRE